MALRVGVGQPAIPHMSDGPYPGLIVDWPLKESIFPSYPKYTDMAPSFNRGSAATVTDFEGRIVYPLSNEMRFRGQNRIQNFCTRTENFASANWASTASGTGSAMVKTPNYTTAPDGTNTACRIQLNKGAGNTGSDYSGVINAGIFTRPLGSRQMNSVWIKSNTGANQNLAIDNWAGGTTNIVATPQWRRVWTTNRSKTTSNPGHFVLWTAGGFGTDQVIDVSIWHPMTEEVTNKACFAPSDYISNGVVSGPYYHGAYADGVQYLRSVKQYTCNMILQSENFNTAPYSNPTEVVNMPNEAPPPGFAAGSVYKFTEDSTTTKHRWFHNAITVNVDDAKSYSWSLWMKAGTMTTVQMSLMDASFSLGYGFAVDVDLIAGTAVVHAGSNASAAATMVSGGNGWWLVTTSVTFVCDPQSQQLWAGVYCRSSGSGGAYTGDGKSYYLFTGASLRPKSLGVSDAYVKTTGTAAGFADAGTYASIPQSPATGYLDEGTRTNTNRNSAMLGGVAGSPGTVPTGWQVSTTMTGVTRTLSFGVENGMPYMDIRFNGTNAVAGAEIRIYQDLVQNAAGSSEIWNQSVYTKQVLGVNPGWANWAIYSDNSLTGTYVSTNQHYSGGMPSSGRLIDNRIGGNITTPAAGTNQIASPLLYCSGIPAVALDFTIRVGPAQLEQALTIGGASTWIPTSGATATRNLDSLSAPHPNFDPSQGASAIDFQVDIAAPNSYFAIQSGFSGLYSFIGGSGAFSAYDSTTFFGASGANIAANTPTRGMLTWGSGAGANLSLVTNGRVGGVNQSFDGSLGVTGGNLMIGGNGSAGNTFGTKSNFKLWSRNPGSGAAVKAVS